MKPAKQRSFKPQNMNRYNESEEKALAKLNTDLKNCDHTYNAIVRIFTEYLQYFEKSGYSIRNIVKLALNNKYKNAFTDTHNVHHSKTIVKLVHKDVTKLRNKRSNPSIFFKFIGINNLNNLENSEIDDLVGLALEKINIYISCDKNVLFLVLKILKLKGSSLSQVSKRNIFEKLLNSYFVYFTELQKEKLRKDFEMIKNYISHFKILALLLPYKLFEGLDYKKQEMIVQITLVSFFIGSSFEERIFNSNKELAEYAQMTAIHVHNDFYFSEKQHPAHMQKIDDEISSFSDFNNCVPQSKFSEEIIKNLYYFVSKLFNGLIDKMPQFFHSTSVWRKVIGENYYITSLLGFFKDINFANSRLPEERMDEQVENLYFNENSIQLYNEKIKGSLKSSVLV